MDCANGCEQWDFDEFLSRRVGTFGSFRGSLPRCVLFAHSMSIKNTNNIVLYINTFEFRDHTYMVAYMFGEITWQPLPNAFDASAHDMACSTSVIRNSSQFARRPLLACSRSRHHRRQIGALVPRQHAHATGAHRVGGA
jgi:hypothetical protein